MNASELDGKRKFAGARMDQSGWGADKTIQEDETGKENFEWASVRMIELGEARYLSRMFSPADLLSSFFLSILSFLPILGRTLPVARELLLLGAVPPRCLPYPLQCCS